MAKELGWTRGRVLDSVRRLAGQNRVRTETAVRHGKLVRIIYTAGYGKPEPGILEIPRKLVDPKQWKGRSATVYALNRRSFLVEPVPADGIRGRKVGLFRARAQVEHPDDNMVVRLPEEIVEFCLLGNSGVAVSSIGDRGDTVMVTVEATTVKLSN